MDEDDFFSDDALDSIPSNDLHALEQQAFSSTQRPPTSSKPPNHSNHILARREKLSENLPWRPSQSYRQAPARDSLLSQNLPRQNGPTQSGSDDYGLDDEEVVDLNDPSTVLQSTSGPTETTSDAQFQKPSALRGRLHPKRVVDPETEAAFAAADAELGNRSIRDRDGTSLVPAGAGAGMDVSALQARIAQLEAEQERLRQSEQEARSAALVKLGEISIVRANQQKAAREYEHRISALQKQHAEETTRAKAELEAGNREREKIQTDNRFLQHEAAQEADRVKRQYGTTKPRQPAMSKETPRKNRKSVMGDGFDDDEVRVLSPSKGKDKSREHTPKAGAKRKRPISDSPVAALSFSQPPSASRNESFEQDSSTFSNIPLDAGVKQDDDRYEHLQLILNHSPYEGHDRTLEALTRFSFPNAPNLSLSSIFLDGIAFSSRQDSEPFPLQTARALLVLWSRCLETKFYKPLYLILDLLRVVLYFELSAISAALIEQAIPLCSRSIDLTVVHITRTLVIPNYGKTVDWTAQERMAEEVNVDEILDFLHTLCNASALSVERNETFWRHVEGTFLVMMLHRALPIQQIVMTLQMLSASVMDATFGVICEDSGQQIKQENGTVDRLTNLLFESPQPPANEPAYTEEEIAELRIEVLKLLQKMCVTDHGGLLLAHHRSAIGRLIRFLDGQVCQLYTVRPSIGMAPQPPGETNLHDLVVQTVNLATRLFYHILRTYDSSIDIVQKLSVVQGGYHKFLISLTRIAFSEQLVFEAGIEDEVVEAAHTILDNVLSPEVGEAVVQAIETPRGTKGSTTEADSPADIQNDSDRAHAFTNQKK